MPDVCGQCGTTESDPETGLCRFFHDYWVQIQDFDIADRRDYVERAAQHLGLTLGQLRGLCQERATPEVIVVVRGGVVQGAKASKQVEIHVLDYDNLAACPEVSDERDYLTRLEQRWEALPEEVLCHISRLSKVHKAEEIEEEPVEEEPVDTDEEDLGDPDDSVRRSAMQRLWKESWD